MESRSTIKLEKNVYQEIQISSIEQILELINEYNMMYNLPRKIDDRTLNVYFRGQADEGWNIEPSVLRADKDEKRLFETIKPELKGKTLFDLIAFMQHYFNGTRFIDFTTNPDVALFFATQECHSINGALYMYCYVNHKPDSLETQIMLEIISVEKDIFSIREISERLWNNPDYEVEGKFDSLSDLDAYIISFFDHGFMVDSNKFDNQNIRVKRQGGCFFITPNKSAGYISSFERKSSTAGNVLFERNKYQVPSDLINGNGLVKIVIPAVLKQDIMCYLKNKGITKEYLFPDNKNCI